MPEGAYNPKPGAQHHYRREGTPGHWRYVREDAEDNSSPLTSARSQGEGAVEDRDGAESASLRRLLDAMPQGAQLTTAEGAHYRMEAGQWLDARGQGVDLDHIVRQEQRRQRMEGAQVDDHANVRRRLGRALWAFLQGAVPGRPWKIVERPTRRRDEAWGRGGDFLAAFEAHLMDVAADALAARPDRAEGVSRLIAGLSPVPDHAAQITRALQPALDDAGVGRRNGARALRAILADERLSAPARLELIGHLTDKHAPWLSTHVEQTVRAAANLAGQHQADAQDVAMAVALQMMGGHPEGFAAGYAAVAAVAEAEGKEIGELLDGARGRDRGTPLIAEALKKAKTARGIPVVRAARQAFPGLVDPAPEAIGKVLSELAAAVPRDGAVKHGADTDVFIAGDHGLAQTLKGRYVLMDAAHLIASHDPSTFSPRADYPDGIQERAYHRDEAEQAKVVRNAEHFESGLVFNTNPDATNGPPVATEEGVVLGGNSRTMSLQRLYRQGGERADKVRAHLKARAHEFGLTPEDIEALAHPVVVRLIEPPDRSHDGMRSLVRALNENFTQAMDPKAEAVALGAKLSDRHLQELAVAMKPDETLRDFLQSARSKTFIDHLSTAGVIDSRNATHYLKRVEGVGVRFTQEGVGLVERVLAGRLVGDADALARAGDRHLTAIYRAAPHGLAAAASGPEYNLGPALAAALDAHATMARHAEAADRPMVGPKDSPEDFERQMHEALGAGLLAGLGADHPALHDPTARKLLELLITRPGASQFAAPFREIADIAKDTHTDQRGLFGAQEVDHGARVRSVLDRHVQWRQSADGGELQAPEPLGTMASQAQGSPKAPASDEEPGHVPNTPQASLL